MLTEVFRQHLRRQIDEILVEIATNRGFMRPLVEQAVKKALAGAVETEVGGRVSALFGPEPGFRRKSAGHRA